MPEARRAGERGPYAGGVARREAILDATVDMVAEVGYHGLSMRDVARRVGISHPGVIYHFPSKDVLLMSVIERYEERLNFKVSSLADMAPFEVFEAFIELANSLGNSQTIVEMECMLTVEASASVHPAHDHFAARFAGLQEVLTDAFTKLESQGMLNTVAQPRQLAYQLLAQWYGLQIQWLYATDEIPVNAVLTQTVLAALDFTKEGVLETVLASSFSSPEAIAIVQRSTGLSLSDMLQRGLLKLTHDNLKRYGLAEVPPEIIDKIVHSGILTSEDLAYAQDNRAFSIEFLGRMVVNGVLTTDEYTVLSDLGIVPAEAVAALTAVMAAGAMQAQPQK
ncbi:TetR/AcrR family transcriptional regulator [Nanchangia anserum]|uniref:TetR/AcrR family transcriptional regulator n=1 Tax=Nanchangia anserum TaxID=2692125 RepID=A0A8I0KNL9_9ACTO|nr:TetR/AcrR family transcriptional regulator [Nanchangia anserum]MBD3689421.1 TetR/AcrR family transcriptional regulator [Nanchangia anserum]QOX81627.1 TetR/AcrR family transcriptional regulator [Nanchangia anserum]